MSKTTDMMDKELYQSINGKSQSEFLSELISVIERQELEIKTAQTTIEAVKQLNNRGKLLIHRARVEIDQQKIDFNREKFNRDNEKQKQVTL